MTAETFLKANKKGIGMLVYNGSVQPETGRDETVVKELLIEYALLKCKEQREICADIVNKFQDIGWEKPACVEKLYNAPEPEI